MTKYCPNCGHVGKATYNGSLLITLILLCFYILPGLVYEIWRCSKGRVKCPSCGQSAMIPADSPMAKLHIKASNGD
jgi:ribosomal protein S27AE